MSGGENTGIYHPPVKRSITIAGHQTSISLEPLFWNRLRIAAEERGLPLNALVAQIDVERMEADDPPGLAGAIRLWLMDQYQRPGIAGEA
ncbi:ribbon-helix-helix domain-containing protein [Sphingorhabdus sp. Alg239-R122]|uniref:ribbon-helix-helix domain-containing protein n=1 Tax=Sphingorhabdus sp. Alg239-R122 TaxID=2305989 RepID=UPI0013D8E664|nr:ribbon-helix-helix domain-containing protein [Sphingorhabdus sp. Alg239-R122]